MIHLPSAPVTLVVPAIIAIVAMTLAGCATAPLMPVHDTTRADLVGTTWRLEQVAVEHEAVTVRGHGELVFSRDGTVHGSAGCHGFDARYGVEAGDASSITVTLTAPDIVHTGCEAIYDEQEAAVFAALGRTFDARVLGELLVLTSGDAATSLSYGAGDEPDTPR